MKLKGCEKSYSIKHDLEYKVRTAAMAKRPLQSLTYRGNEFIVNAHFFAHLFAHLLHLPIRFGFISTSICVHHVSASIYGHTPKSGLIRLFNPHPKIPHQGVHNAVRPTVIMAISEYPTKSRMSDQQHHLHAPYSQIGCYPTSVTTYHSGALPDSCENLLPPYSD